MTDPDEPPRELPPHDVDADEELAPDVDADEELAPDVDADEELAPDVDADEVDPPAHARHGSTAAEPRGLNGWSGLRKLASPRFNASQLIVAVLCACLGFALIVQVHQTQSDSLSSLAQSDLVRLADEVTQRDQVLQKEYSSLESTKEKLEAGSGSRQAAIDLATSRAQTQGILSGRLKAQGPGITLRLVEGTSPIPAATMFDVLEELRNAGAEAVQINGVRLVSSSYFVRDEDTLVVDGQSIRSPFSWTAIGKPATLAPALAIPGGALAAVRATGASATVTQSDLVRVTATRTPTVPKYATPVAPATGS